MNSKPLNQHILIIGNMTDFNHLQIEGDYILKKITIIAAIMTSMVAASTASAEVGIGLALSLNTKGEVGAGPRLFTSKRSDRFVGSVGVNYNFMSKDFEPVAGIGYALDNTFIGAEASYRLKQKDFNVNGTFAVR